MTIYAYILIAIIIIGGLIYYYLRIKPLSEEKIRDLYLEGLDLLISGHRKKAYQYFKKIIDQDTDNIKSYIKMGQIIRESKNPKQALKIHHSIAMRKDISEYEKIELHKNISLDYYALGDMVHAIDECLYILKVDKNNEWAISQLIKYFIQSEQWENASIYLIRYNKIKKIKSSHKLALFKIQQGRQMIDETQFDEGRLVYEEALNLHSSLSIAYYFIGNSYSVESEIYYKKANSSDIEINSQEYKTNMEKARKLLAKSIPMWIRYSVEKPEQSWLVIHLLKDALFVLNRFNEFEMILKNILESDPDNLEVLASLADIHNQRNETSEALDLMDGLENSENTSLLVKLIRVKLQARKQSDDSAEITKQLDDIIHGLAADEQFQKNNKSDMDKDLLWIHENSKENLIK